MKRTLILAAVIALAFASGADAKSCKDAKGKFTKCPPAASITKTTDTSSPAMAAMPMKGHPNCKKGKLCGNSCISMKDICHK